KIPKVSKKVLTLFTVCFAFLLTFASAGGFAANSPAENAIGPEDIPEGVYRRFSPGEEVTYLVVMHKKGVLAGDPFKRTYIGIESVRRSHPSHPDGSVFMAARLRSSKELKLNPPAGNGPVPTDGMVGFLLDYAETVNSDGTRGLKKNQSQMYAMQPAFDGRINIIGAETLPAPLCGHYIPVTDRPAPLVLQQAMIKYMLEDFIPAATNMDNRSQFYDYKMQFLTGDNPPVDCWAGWYLVQVREDRNMDKYDSRYQMNFIVGDTGDEIKLLTLYDGKMWPVYEDDRLKSKTNRGPQVVPKG
ncbi:MAG: hypothetical protein J6W55_01645, partial [Acidaminococcaceae bacterium]|nr:hypothetical protein [Acidaminococcaceae bacterium]